MIRKITKSTELTRKEWSKAKNGPKRPKKFKLSLRKDKGRASSDGPLAPPRGEPKEGKR